MSERTVRRILKQINLHRAANGLESIREYEKPPPGPFATAFESISGFLAISAFFLIVAASWIYCIAAYGFLFGVGLGWLPSLICGTAAALTVRIGWPFILSITVILPVTEQGASSFPWNMLDSLRALLLQVLQHWLNTVGLG